jgi:hypothetical protein
MKVTEINGIKTYDLNAAKSLKQYLDDQKNSKMSLRKLRQNDDELEL